MITYIYIQQRPCPVYTISVNSGIDMSELSRRARPSVSLWYDMFHEMAGEVTETGARRFRERSIA